MKKTSKLAAILTALALALALAACSHPNSGDDSSGSSSNSGGTQATYLDGTYKMRAGNHGEHYLFLPDGTIEVNTGFHGANEGSGTYTIRGNTLSGNANGNANRGEDTLTFTGRKDSDGKWFATRTNGDPDYTGEEVELIRQ